MKRGLLGLGGRRRGGVCGEGIPVSSWRPLQARRERVVSLGLALPVPCALPAPLVLSAPCALPVPFTLHPPCTLHPVPCLHPAHSLHPAYTLLSRCSCSLHPLRALPLPTPCPCPTCSPPTPCLHPCPASTAAHTLPSPSPGTWGYPCLHAPGQSTVAEGGEPGSAAANLLSPPNKASGRNLWALRSCTAPALGSCLHTAAL